MIPAAEFLFMDPESVVVYIDGSSRGNPGPSGIGVVIFSKHNREEPLAQISRYIGITTNNVAEYEALIYALKWLIGNRISRAKIKLDSELIYKQLMGKYKVKKLHLTVLLDRVAHLLNEFKEINLELIPRTKNALANKLAQRASKLLKTTAPQSDKEK